MSKLKSATKRPFRERFAKVVMIALILIGVGLFTYPFVSDALTTAFDEFVIYRYQKEAQRKNEEELEKSRQEMLAYNQKIEEEKIIPNEDPLSDEGEAKAQKEESTTNLDFFQEHTLGIVSIPSIDVRLPIFDKTSETFLKRGTGLLKGSSMPVGGEGRHAVIIAHRALADAKLFSDLPEVQLGEQFFIEVNNEILAYEVDRILTIEPTEIEYLFAEPGQDYVTLMTCTPYMVNSHRLIVRGYRVPYVAAKAAMTNPPINKVWILVSSICGVLLLFLLWFLYKHKKRKKARTSQVTA